MIFFFFFFFIAFFHFIIISLIFLGLIFRNSYVECVIKLKEEEHMQFRTQIWNIFRLYQVKKNNNNKIIFSYFISLGKIYIKKIKYNEN